MKFIARETSLTRMEFRDIMALTVPVDHTRFQFVGKDSFGAVHYLTGLQARRNAKMLVISDNASAL
jgi:hypothetical protein